MIASIINIVIFLVAQFMFLRIYYSNLRIERYIIALKYAFEKEEEKRLRHMELIRVELESLNRTKQQLKGQLEDCKFQTGKIQQVNEKEGEQE